MDRRRFLRSMAAAGAAASCPVCLSRLAQAADGDGTPHWSYSGADGPSNWGSLHEDWALCGSGARQSPVDLRDPEFVTVPDWIGIRYQRMPINITNNGHTVQFNASPGSLMVVKGEQWMLRQFHFHSPSEHTVDGRPFAMEAHFVHEKINEPGKLGVIGVLMERSITDNEDLEEIFRVMPTAAGQTYESGRQYNPRVLIPDSRSSWRYFGSLTTPPCSEEVRWMVMAETLRVSAKQIRNYRLAVPGRSNRPVQPLNQRFLLRSE